MRRRIDQEDGTRIILLNQIERKLRRKIHKMFSIPPELLQKENKETMGEEMLRSIK